MNAYERFACDFCLSDYDDDASFAQVISDINDYSETITPWHLFEDLPPSQLTELLRDMALSAAARFTVKEK